MVIMGNKKKSMINAILGPDPSEAASEDSPPGESLTTMADELIKAVKDGDTQGVVEAFRAMFLELESQPHEENEEGEPLGG